MNRLALILVSLLLVSCSNKADEFWKGFKSTFFSPGWEDKLGEKGVIFDKNPYDGVYYSKFMFMDVAIKIEGDQMTHVSSYSAEIIVDCKQYHDKVVYTDAKGAKRVLRPRGDSVLYMFMMGKEMLYYKQKIEDLAKGEFYFPKDKELDVADFLPKPVKREVKKKKKPYTPTSYKKPKPKPKVVKAKNFECNDSSCTGGWVWDFKPEPNDTSRETGHLVFEIKIDDQGEILSVRRLESTVSPTIEKIYRQSVEQLTFSKTSDNALVAPITTGKITFQIRIKNNE